jgi:putative transposase
VAYRCVTQRIIHTPGTFFHAIGGTETHAHLAVSVPPTLPISEFIGQLKGVSCHEVNQKLGLHGKQLQWQTGYGVVSFGTGHLEWVREYIQNQREHHSRGHVYDRLERVFGVDDAREEEPRKRG